MLVRRFLDRLAEAAPAERAEIVQALVRVYLEAPLDTANRADAITAMIAILDDPAPRVRRAMAEALADSPEAPRAIMLALADDQPDIAEIVLARSPVPGEGDLVDIVGTAGERQRTAIATRPFVGIGLSAAIVEVSEPPTCLALIGNANAEIAGSTFRRLVERHRKDAAVRGALLERDDLPLPLRQSLVDGLSEALGELVVSRQWLAPERAERMLRDAGERAIVALAATAAPDRLRPLIAELRDKRRLTPGLILRAASQGHARFLEEALSLLSGMPLRRVSSLVHDRHGSGFAALYRRTGLPAEAHNAFCAVVTALGEGEGERTGRPLVERVAAQYRRLSAVEVDEFHGLFGRLATESARNEARKEAGGYFRAA